MYLVSVGEGGECVCVKGSLVLVLVLDWTQCPPARSSIVSNIGMWSEFRAWICLPGRSVV